MKVGWIAPLHKKCGIAFYAERYAEALSSYCTVIKLDPEDFVRSGTDFLSALTGCSCVHIQYETSFFLHGRADFYPDLCGRIGLKKIVTLHELYRTVPGVFPREDILGAWPLKAIKRMAWDVRHPHWAAFARHQAAQFHADAVIVHSNFQKEILSDKRFDPDKIVVIPLPIRKSAAAEVFKVNVIRPAVLGATGFINPAYDYELLFRVLEAMTTEWRFIWVGGVRRDEDRRLLRWIEHEIDARGWRDRFTITGWVPDDERDRLLKGMHVFCAFFKERSSSESLGDAIAARTPVIACRIPLTEEISRYGPVLVLAPSEPEAIALTILKTISDKALLQKIEQAQANYSETNSPANCARSLVALYEKLINTGRI
jgi:glycosyltransferase involved in cell wall biosynthesis